MLTVTETQSLQQSSSIAPVKVIGDLHTYQYNVDISTTVEEVSNTLKRDPDLHGVLLLDGNTCFGTASRLKLFELLGRPFGIDLFFKKPIGHLFKTTQLSRTVLPHTLSIDKAVIKLLKRPPEVRYEPIVLSREDGNLHLLDMNVLLMAQADQLAIANRLIEKQVERTQAFNQVLETRVRERTAELQQANYKLEALDQNKTNFINFALQELMTPMLAVSGISQILEIDSSLKKKQRTLVNKMAGNIKSLNKIISSMVDVARLDAQEMELSYTRLNLYSMIIEITEELKPAMRERQIKCKLKHLDVIPTMLGDAQTLRKVFYNLIVNAIKYTPPGGKITVKARNPAQRNGKDIPSAVQITISDTGIGINPKDQEMVFDKFFRSKSQPASNSFKINFRDGGSGLGLAIAKGIVEAHGGQVWVESPGQDEIECPGSSFHVALPIPNISINKDPSPTDFS
jgi:signal transduction histidine kinase